MIQIVQARGAKTHLVSSAVRNPDEPQTQHVETMCGREMEVTDNRPRIVLGETDKLRDDFCKVCLTAYERDTVGAVSSTVSTEPTEPTERSAPFPITAESFMTALDDAIEEAERAAFDEVTEGMDNHADEDYAAEVVAMSETSMVVSGMVKLVGDDAIITLPTPGNNVVSEVVWTAHGKPGSFSAQWIAETYELAQTMCRQMYRGRELHGRIRHVRNSKRRAMKDYIKQNG